MICWTSTRWVDFGITTSGRADRKIKALAPNLLSVSKIMVPWVMVLPMILML